MLSLGLVPKGQESILQYVKRPSDQKEPGAQAPTEKNLEQKLLELNRPSQHQAGRGQIDAEQVKEESKDQDAPKAFLDPRFDDAFGQGDALGLPRPAEEKGSEREQPRRNPANVFKSFAMGDDFDEDDDDDFRLRKRSEIIVSQDDLVAKSLPCDGAFILSPILAHSANQERIKAIIEDVDEAEQDQGFVFEEVGLAPPRHTQGEGGLEPLLEP